MRSAAKFLSSSLHSPPDPRTIKGTLSLLSFVNSLIGSTQDVIDDLICLSKIGAVDEKFKELAPTSDRLWFATIHLDLVDAIYAHLETRKKLRQEKRVTTKDGAESNNENRTELRFKLFLQKISIIKVFTSPYSSYFAITCFVDTMYLGLEIEGFPRDGK